MIMVFLTSPLGLIGVVPTLLLFNQPFGINALVGLIALSGILMRNTLILIGQISQNRKEGLAPFDAVIEATVQRSRPVLLTALAAQVPLEDVVSTMTDGFGSTLASVALLVGLGAMLGRLLEFSGGAQVLADVLIRRFGEQRAPLALGVAALLFGFPAAVASALPSSFVKLLRRAAPCSAGVLVRGRGYMYGRAFAKKRK